jgi:hypothetical protein
MVCDVNMRWSSAVKESMSAFMVRLASRTETNLAVIAKIRITLQLDYSVSSSQPRSAGGSPAVSIEGSARMEAHVWKMMGEDDEVPVDIIDCSLSNAYSMFSLQGC